MDILEILNEYLKETEFIPHPFIERTLEFRYTYAVGITMAIFLELDNDFNKELDKFYRSLNLEDKAEEIKATGNEPTKELLMEVVKVLELVFQKQMFLLDIHKMSNSNREASKKIQEFIEGMVKVLELTQDQKKTLVEYIDIFVNVKIEVPKVLESCRKKLDYETIANMIIYFFKPNIKDFLKEMNREILSLSKLPKNNQLTEKLKNYRNIKKTIDLYLNLV